MPKGLERRYGQCHLHVSRKLRKTRQGSESSSSQSHLGDETHPTLPSFWQRRFYDFNVWSTKKRHEKLHYMHFNPVQRGLVTDPRLWAWSSYRFYRYGERSTCTPNPTAW